jgi:hypothetical protein
MRKPSNDYIIHEKTSIRKCWENPISNHIDSEWAQSAESRRRNIRYSFPRDFVKILNHAVDNSVRYITECGGKR